MGCRTSFGLCCLVLALGPGGLRAKAECALFYDSLNDADSIAASGGEISGTVVFVPGINGHGALFDGASHVAYSDTAFATATGSVTLWFMRTGSDSAGGILQIGTLGSPNSLGLFYVDEDDLCFELRNSSGDLTQVCVPDVLLTAEWVHVGACWRDRGEGCDLWLFLNGDYTVHQYLPGSFAPTADFLQIGQTGFYYHAQGVIDEIRFFDWNLLDSEVFAEYVYSSGRYCRQPTDKPVSTGPVQVLGKSLYVDGEPFTVKGVGYAPTPIGYWPWDVSVYTDLDILMRDVTFLQDMNVNTVRTWAQPPDTTLLDVLYAVPAEPIYTIVGFWIPVSGIDYGDPGTIAYYEDQFRDLVNQFKDHPGVLGWGLGNEVNLHHDGEALVNWYSLANRLAQAAYEEEGATYHPTIIVNAGMFDLGSTDLGSDDASLDAIDVWGHNTYVGAETHCYFDYYDRLSAKPLIFTEYGIDAWNDAAGAVYQDVQAEYVVRQWRQIESGCAGGTVMAYSDEWWKAGEPDTQDFGGYPTGAHPDGFSNEEWWGMVSVEDNGSEPDLVHPRLVHAALGLEYEYAAGDYDDDGDVDLMDLAAFQVCCGSDAAGVCGIVFDFKVDDVLDHADFQALAPCCDGPDRAALCTVP